MHLQFKLRIRLLLFLWAIFFLALVVPSAYYTRHLKNEILAETRTRATRELALIRGLLLDEKAFPDSRHLQDWLQRISGNLGIRISYIAEGGRVIADTDVPFDQIPNLDNHAARPEIIGALRSDTGSSMRYSGTIKSDLLYIARQIDGRGSIPRGVLRIAVPLSSVFYVLSNAGTVQNLAIVVGFLVFAIISLWLIVHTSRSVSILASAADSIGKENVKVPGVFRAGHDFYPLAKSIRETAERVESFIKTITRQKLQLESILEGIEEGILLLNAGGKIDSANRAARNMLSFVPLLKGRRPLEVIRSPELQRACNMILQNEMQTFHTEVSIGEDVFYQVHIVRINHPKQEPGAIIALYDISELKRLEKIRRDFVANASHELRTPLTSIKGYTEMLMSEESDPDIRSQSIQVIYKNTDHIIKIVNDLLELAKVEEYSPAMNVQSVNAAEALMEAWKECAPLAEKKGIELRNDLPEDGPLVRADFDQLSQVFRNLLENAAKYGPSGEPVRVFCSKEQDHTTFGVSDTGPGIPKSDQQRIFERFFRVERHRGKETGSTGLGLAICRHIVRNHGGTIWVESPPKDKPHGSTFYFTLPPDTGENA